MISLGSDRAADMMRFAIAGVVLASIALLGCQREDSGLQNASMPKEIRGTPIGGVASNRPSAQVTAKAEGVSSPGEMEGEFLKVSFDQLSNFKYDTYEVYDEVHGGRPFTRSDDVIPPHIKGLDGKRIVLKGFIMPLRLKKGLVTEFLLFRDQAACCFGPAAKINHYVRVTVEGKGFEPGSQVTHKVQGALRVGEILVQGYLTGIYQMTATDVREDP